MDILAELSLLSQYQAMHREGQLEVLLHILHYLNNNSMKHIVFDRMKPEVKKLWFDNEAYWRELYGTVKEEEHTKIPEKLDNLVTVSWFFDFNHNMDVAMRRLHMGVLVLVDISPTEYFRKRHNTVKFGNFGSELVAVIIVTDMIAVFCIKMKCFGMMIAGASNVFFDN